MTTKLRTETRPATAPAGFTLVELSVVIAIIGILVSFILVAGAEGVRRAEARATEGQVARLDWAINQKLDAILETPFDSPNGGHQWLASMLPAGYSKATQAPWYAVNDPPTRDRRAVAIALHDYVRMEMPDVFTVLSAAPGANEYALNFAGVAWPMTGGSGTTSSDVKDAYVLPVGHMAWGFRFGHRLDDTSPTSALLDGPGDLDPRDQAHGGDRPDSVPIATYMLIWRSRAKGIYGASWTARGSLHKLLGAHAQGYDGVDNDRDGWIDEWDECTGAAAGAADATARAATMSARLASHTHKTARAEALYALVCEGIGPTGSFFSRDDFAANQVADTDGDGLPEFVDAWGEPLQFYRWPALYASDRQRGPAPYQSALETRDSNPLDPSNSLVAVGWWSKTLNVAGSASTSQISYRGWTFMQQFGPLVDLNFGVSGAFLWDRGGTLARRAYSTRPLILSSGPDKQLGVAQLGFNYSNYLPPFDTVSGDNYPLPGAVDAVPVTPENLVLLENPAPRIAPFRSATNEFLPALTTPAVNGVTAGLSATSDDGWGLDDISSHNVQNSGGVQ
jgi:prepilin-type N-terminal cleavage/methylation domain-containing protein